MPSKVFICYRRDDVPGDARGIHEALVARFGKASIFMDVANLLAGQRFDEELAKALDVCDVLIAIIGPRWMELLRAKVTEGERDYVRQEIAAALKRKIAVIPVRVGREGAMSPLPRSEDLPEDIRDLLIYQKQDVAHERFRRDAKELVESIIAVRHRNSKTWLRLVGAGGLVAAVAAAGYLLWHGSTGQDGRVPANETLIVPDSVTLVAKTKDQVTHGNPSGERVHFVKKGDTAMSILRELGATPDEARAIAATLGARGQDGGLKEGEKLRVLMGPASAASDARLAPYRVIVANNTTVEAVAALSDLGKYVAVDVESMYTANLLPETSVPPGSGRGFRDCAKVCPEMVVVPKGTFMMGSTENESEGPLHTVTISKPFAVGRYAITFEEWDACVEDGECNGYKPTDEGWGRGKRPVINVSWLDAKAYTSWLSRKTAKPYRLLSEAEREYVTRAGTVTPFWWGSSISTSQANYDGTSSDGPTGDYRKQTVPVDSFKPNPWGLYQVHGNVWEWCEDNWHDNYQEAPADGSVWSGGDLSFRALRGGSWYFSPPSLRSASRRWSPSDSRNNHIGFRVARML